MTSGGTESIMMSVYTAREYAREEKGIREPEMVMPETAHPAWAKAAHYFSLNVVETPVQDDWRADTNALEKTVTDETALVVGSAPSYPHGVVDPIGEMGEIAETNHVLFHVDSCIGGFMLPFLRELGYDVPDFGFEVPGVTSVSLDPHKYGYAAKGASVIAYRNRDIRQYQYYAYDDWPGGIYATPNMQGTRPGGPIAATWAVMKYLGTEGYVELAQTVMDTTERLMEGIEGMDELSVVSDPDMCIFAVESTTEDVDIWAVHEELTNRGWELERQQNPPSIHLSVMYTHAPIVDEFMADLRDAVEAAKRRDDDSETAPMYGLSADVARDEDVKEVVLDLMNSLFQ